MSFRSSPSPSRIRQHEGSYTSAVEQAAAAARDPRYARNHATERQAFGVRDNCMRRVCSEGLAVLLVCALAGGAAAQTVREWLRDPNLRVYSVIFAIVIGRDSSLQSFRVAKVTDPKSGSTRAVPVDVPDEYLKAARRKVEAKGYQPKFKDGEPVEFFTYVFYLPSQPAIVITDLDKPLDNQP